MGGALEAFMERASIRENIRKAIRKLSRRSLKEILAYTVRGEMDSTELYRYLHRNLPEGYPRETFKRFVSMEEDHDRKVRSVFKSLFPGEEIPDVSLKSWARIFMEKDFRLKTVGDYLNALRLGMEAEQLSEGVYLMLADMLDNPSYVKIMHELARDEREHYEFLKREYDTYSEIESKKALKELIEEIIRDRKSTVMGS